MYSLFFASCYGKMCLFGWFCIQILRQLKFMTANWRRCIVFMQKIRQRSRRESAHIKVSLRLEPHISHCRHNERSWKVTMVLSKSTAQRGANRRLSARLLSGNHLFFLSRSNICCRHKEAKEDLRGKNIYFVTFPIQKTFFQKVFTSYIAEMTIKIIHWVTCKIIHIYIYIYLFNIQNTLHIRSSTDPLFYFNRLWDTDVFGYIKISSLMLLMKCSLFLPSLNLKLYFPQGKLVVDIILPVLFSTFILFFS